MLVRGFCSPVEVGRPNRMVFSSVDGEKLETQAVEEKFSEKIVWLGLAILNEEEDPVG